MRIRNTATTRSFVAVVFHLGVMAAVVFNLPGPAPSKARLPDAYLAKGLEFRPRGEVRVIAEWRVVEYPTVDRALKGNKNPLSGIAAINNALLK